MTVEYSATEFIARLILKIIMKPRFPSIFIITKIEEASRIYPWSTFARITGTHRITLTLR